mmetsp:Transcript_1712/g.6794  ORF Transcript_1712/g.6794 Transcript_1712/m.6794 type:complete len:158 (-) Transcript_1712:1708-2181(-)
MPRQPDRPSASNGRGGRAMSANATPLDSPQRATPLRRHDSEGMERLAEAADATGKKGTKRRVNKNKVESLRNKLSKRIASTGELTLREIKRLLDLPMTPEAMLTEVRKQIRLALDGKNYGINKYRNEFNAFQAGTVDTAPNWPERDRNANDELNDDS